MIKLINRSFTFIKNEGLLRKAVRAGVCGGVDDDDGLEWFFATAKETLFERKYFI